MGTLDMILYRRGPDDGEHTTFYTFVVDKENPDDYPRNDIVDRFNKLTWDQFFAIDKLALSYKGPREGFMKEFAKILNK